MDVECGVTSDVAPVHCSGVQSSAPTTPSTVLSLQCDSSVAGASNQKHSGRQPETGETEVPCSGATPAIGPQTVQNCQQQPQAAVTCDTDFSKQPADVVRCADEDYDCSSCDTGSSGMDLNAQEMLEQCSSCGVGGAASEAQALLPKTTEEVSTQTLPDQGPPPYVDIRSPMMRGGYTVTEGAPPDFCAPLGGGPCTPLLDRSLMAVSTPGQCTPLLEPKSEHCGLNFPPIPPPPMSNLMMNTAPSVISGSETCLSVSGGVGGIPTLASQLAASEKQSETGSVMLPICRICHMPGELEDEQEMLISPCRCAGTLQFIHNTCLQRWLEISAKKSRKPPKCELCHYQYHRHKKFKFSHWRFPRVSRQDKVLHVIFIVNLVIMIGCAVATVMCFLSDKGQITKFPRNKEVDLTTEEIITLSCGVLFFVSFFIAMSVQIKAKHTVYQLCVKFIMHNMEWEIDEYDKSKDTMFTSGSSSKASKQHAAFV